jgi:branched-chain amino acid transport system permease protein
MYYLTDLLAAGCINALMVVGLNLQYGYAGILNVAYYTYVAVGAYIAAVTTLGPSTTPNVMWILGWHLPWYLGILAGGFAAAAMGAVTFSFTISRLRSDYVAIVTIAAAFIIWNIINQAGGLFGGASGVFGVPLVTGHSTVSIVQYALVIFGIAGSVLILVVILSRRIFRSPYGRLLRAIREDEHVVAAFGRHVWRANLWVFIVGCFIAGIAGGIFVFYLSAFSPLAFLPLESFFLLSALIIGGSGNYWGAVLGAFTVIEGLNELSRFAPSFGDPAAVGAIRVIIIGVVMLLVLRFRPEGLIPERWLHWYGAKRRGLAFLKRGAR